jgi:hypothetical protein
MFSVHYPSISFALQQIVFCFSHLSIQNPTN